MCNNTFYLIFCNFYYSIIKDYFANQYNMLTNKKINIGCGMTPTKNWSNYDYSTSIKLSKYPTLSNLLYKLNIISKDQINFIKFCSKNEIGLLDATKTFPFSDSSINAIYSSHMMEHLHRDDVISFIKECYRVLSPKGILRLVLPDLRINVENYLKSNDADKFIEDLLIQPPKTKTISDLAKLYFSGGFRDHQWMYDENSLIKLLSSCGFKNVVALPPGKTNIPNESNLDLHERKKESIYVEGIK